MSHDTARPSRRALARGLLAALMLAGAAPARARAQDAPAPVKVTAALASPSVQAGDVAEVRFHVAVPAGQHVYPPGSTDGVPIEAKLEGDARGIAADTLTPSVTPKTVDIPGIGKVQELEGSFDVVWR